MSWSTPVTVVTGTVIQASWGNTYVRDNTRYLKGMDGGVVFDSAIGAPGLAIDSPTLVVDSVLDRVGIGTASPQAMLSLGPVLANTKLALFDNNTGLLYGLGVQDNEFRFNLGGPTARYNFRDAPAGAILATITGAGRFGLGGVDPAATMSLGPTVANMKLALYDNGASFYGMGVQSSEFRIFIPDNTAKFNWFAGPNAASPIMTLMGNARLGINNGAPGFPLDVVGHIHTSNNVLADGYFIGNASQLWELNATQLTSGVIPDARFPLILPALSGRNLFELDAADLFYGTIPTPRFPNPLPGLDGQYLYNLNAGYLTAGIIPAGRFPNPLPALSGQNLTNLPAANLIGTIPPGSIGALSGDGSSITNINAAAIAFGNLPIDRLLPHIDFQIFNNIANGGTAAITIDPEAFGLLVVIGVGDSVNGACFLMHGTAHRTTEFGDIDGRFSVNSGTAGSTNIYWSGSRYEVQNNTGVTRTYYTVMLDIDA